MSDEKRDDEIHEAEVEEVPPAGAGSSPSQALEPVVARPTVPSVTPQVAAAELGVRLEVIREAMDAQMQEGVDYGKVPGTDKPALFKPGAEKLSVLFRLDVQPRSEKHWGPGEHLTVSTYATVYDIETGARIGFGEGLCTSREKKYGKRKQDRTCPACGAATIKRSKYPPRDEPGKPPGWYCYEKLGGCGANFDHDADDITEQPIGEVENPDLPDTWNTIVKMAEKRARVDAVLAVTGASAIFTQDIDEQVSGAQMAAGVELPLADEAEKDRLRGALKWLLPQSEGERVWGEIKAAFGGELVVPAVVAASVPIEAIRQIREDEAATEREAAEDDTKPQDDAERGDDPAPADESQVPPDEDGAK